MITIKSYACQGCCNGWTVPEDVQDIELATTCSMCGRPGEPRGQYSIVPLFEDGPVLQLPLG